MKDEDIDVRYAVKQSSFHLAGIIPVHGQELDYEMDWHPCLTQIAPNYTAIENAVVECAYAGCETIWIVVNEGDTPLIRKRVGEFIQDPVNLQRTKMGVGGAPENRYIPIYYVPVRPMDVGRRDSLSWSVIRGAYVSMSISSQLSSWTAPDRFYVKFPYGIYDYEQIRPARQTISSIRPFYGKHDGQTVHDNLYMPFTMVYDEIKKSKVHVRHEETGMKDKSQPKEEWFKGEVPTRKLPTSEQYTARWFGPQKVFEKAVYKKDRRYYLELDWYYDISSWEGYKKYMASDNEAKKPPRDLFRPRKWDGIGKKEVDS